MSLLQKFDAMTAVRAELAARGVRPFGAVNENVLSGVPDVSSLAAS